MLYLWTGLPGSQKTANMINYVRTQLKGDWAGRQVYFYNIKGLSIEGWIEIDEAQARLWYELPEGSIVLIDEAQKLFRPVTRKDQVAPREITELEEHRHAGYDICLTTQHPMLIHTAVRRQVQSHNHLERPYGVKTKQLHWEKCKNDPDDHFARKDAEITSVKVPKDTFQLYTSTVMNTHKRKIPKKAIIALVLFLVVGGLAINFASKFIGDKTPADSIAAVTGGSELPAGVTPAQADHGFKAVYPLDPQKYMDLYKPRVAGIPATAPIYDDLQKPVVAPKNLCYSYRSEGVDHCKCVTQQNTPIQIGFAQCKEIVNNGLWDPTYKPANYDARGNYGKAARQAGAG